MEYLIIGAIIIVGLLLQLFAGGLDNDRIATEIKAKGGTLISKERNRFGSGWLGEESNRIYRVVYKDKEGHTHEAFVKTSMNTGVYFSKDNIIKYAQKEEEEEPKLSYKEENKHLKLENAKLKEELEALKRKKE